MALPRLLCTALGAVLAAGLTVAAVTAAPEPAPARGPLTLASARVTIDGTSNIHAYTASTDSVRITRLQLASGVAGPPAWDALIAPGAVEAFEIAIPAASLSSPKDGLDKNMHKALNTKEHPEITFRLVRLAAGDGASGALRATGVLTIAGVEREITFALQTEQRGATLTVRGEVPLLMTDFRIKPPTAMLGMLKTDPKVTVTFETVLSVPLT